MCCREVVADEEEVMVEDCWLEVSVVDGKSCRAPFRRELEVGVARFKEMICLGGLLVSSEVWVVWVCWARRRCLAATCEETVTCGSLTACMLTLLLFTFVASKLLMSDVLFPCCPPEENSAAAEEEVAALLVPPPVVVALVNVVVVDEDVEVEADKA